MLSSADDLLETRNKLTVAHGVGEDSGGVTQVLNRAFSRAHAMSIHLNLITIGATVWYGMRLVSRFGAGLE